MHDLLCDTAATEWEKTLSVWSMFADADLPWRPADPRGRGRSVHEQFVHQCVSEDGWFMRMLGIDLGRPALPTPETRLAFIAHYAAASAARLERLRAEPETWWSSEVRFFDVGRSRAWVVMRRLLHTAHHRGQLTAYLRALGREAWSTYGPTADTGGLAVDGATTLYAYPDVDSLLAGEAAGGAKRALPAPPARALSERPLNGR